MERRNAILTLPALLGAIFAAAPSRAQTFEEFPLPTENAGPQSIAAGPDGNLWFTESSAGKIGRITPDGSIVEYPLPSSGSEPWRIAAGPDGAMWFTEMLGNRIGRISMSGAIEEFDVPTAKSLPMGIAAGSDGAMWFTEREGNRVGRISVSGGVTEFPLAAHIGPNGIVAGSDGALWFAEQYAQRAGRITTSGAWTQTPYFSSGGYPQGIAAAPDGSIWITTVPGAGGEAVRIASSGTSAHDITEYTPGDPTVDADGNLWYPTSDGTIGRLDRQNRTAVFAVPTVGAFPTAVAIGPDGKVWFTESEADRIGRLDPSTSSSCGAPAAPELSVDGGTTIAAAPGESFTLSWTATLGVSAGHYTVLRSEGSLLGFTPIATTTDTALRLAATSEEAGTSVYFEVRATKECGASSASSSASDAVSVAVSGAPPPPPSGGCSAASGGRPCVVPVAPAAPAGVDPRSPPPSGTL